MSHVVLVTGGTGVLGSALVETLCEQGCEVTANFWHDSERAHALRERTGCYLAQADMSDAPSVEALVRQGAYDAIVHCAGGNRNALLFQTSVEMWSNTLQSHLSSAFFVTQAALGHSKRGSQVMLVASRVGERGGQGQSAYAAAKAGVLGLMHSAAIEGREHGIAFNAVCPGFAVSTSTGALSAAALKARSKENELPDADAAQSFAAFVSWFLMNRSQVTGQILRPDCRI